MERPLFSLNIIKMMYIDVKTVKLRPQLWWLCCNCAGASCLLEGYEVLASSPVNFRFSNLETSYGILHWDTPEVNSNTYSTTFLLSWNIYII